jgi:hypothetical protein
MNFTLEIEINTENSNHKRNRNKFHNRNKKNNHGLKMKNLAESVTKVCIFTRKYNDH